MSQTGRMPAGGRTWFDTYIRKLLDFLLSILVGNTKLYSADVVMVLQLGAATYANGTLGAGATLTANANGAFPVIDGLNPFTNMLVLLANQGLVGPHLQNGLWTLTSPGSATTPWVLTRSTLLDVQAKWTPGMKFGVKSGTLWGGSVWAFDGPALPTVGTTAVGFIPVPKLRANRGVIPSARVAFSVQPTANDTITIGGIAFKFVGAIGAAVAQVQVLIGGNAAATLQNIINAINGDAASAGTSWLEATTPFAAAVTADAATATSLRIKNATARGGLPVAGLAPSTVLAASVSGGAAAWNLANLNQVGADDRAVGEAAVVFTATSAMIAAGTLNVELPFTPTGFQVQILTATGGQRLSTTDTFATQNNSILVTFAGGAAPAIQNTDVVSICAWQ